MVVAPDLAQLLQQPEGDTLDFKRSYDLSTETARLRLVKDILCMANTPRDDSAFLVAGVNKHPDGSFDVVGIKQPPDEANIQMWIAERVYPIPTVHFHTTYYDGKLLCILEIPPERRGPFVPIRSHGELLHQRQVYFRRGSRNEVAAPDDLRRIVTWIQGGRSEKAPLYTEPETEWERFLRLVTAFDQRRSYILVAPPIDPNGATDISAFGCLPWCAAIDFDPGTETSGLLKAMQPELETRRSLHLVAKSNRPTINPTNATYWLFAGGMEGRRDTPPVTSHQEWIRRYQNNLVEQIRALASAILPTPTTCVILCASPSFRRLLRSAAEILASLFADALSIVVVSQNPTDCSELATELDSPSVSMPFNQLCAGIRMLTGERETPSAAEVALPSSSGAPIAIDGKEVLWLQEELDIVHLSVGVTPAEGRHVGTDFLRGAEIDWYELGLHYDIDRDRTTRLKRQLRSALESRRAVRLNLYHGPGAGGTTIAKRLLWDFRADYPSLILLRCLPHDTVERLFRIASRTGNPVLLLVDGALTSERIVDQLYELVRSRQIPVVILQVLRRFKAQPESEHSTYLSAELSISEARRFVDVYARDVPAKRSELERVLLDRLRRARTAFYIGLITYEKEFRGLTRYVEARVSNLSEPQRDALVYLAIAHHYGQRSLPAQAFADLFGVPQSRQIDMMEALGTEALELLVPSGESDWRTVHDVVAVELLSQIVPPSGADRRAWKQFLSLAATAFGHFCRGRQPVVSEELLEVVERVFIYRDNLDLLGTERAANRLFSELIEDIPSREGALGVLRELAEIYPNEAHILAHVGRFYAMQMRNYDAARRYVERAVQLRERDHVLHHMAGMIFRYEIYDRISQHAPLEEIAELGERASEWFAKARELSPGEEHGLVSEAQMRLKILDYAGRQFGKGAVQYIASSQALAFVRESLGQVEDLLAELRRTREGEGSSEYEEKCRAQLDSLYGRYDSALQTMDGLLARPDVYKPPVRRQLVWTYLARRGRSWRQLKPREAERIVDPLQEDLDQEPYNDRDLRLWIQGIRRIAAPPSLEAVIEQVAYWKANSDDLDATFYLYVLYALEAMEGSEFAGEECGRYLDESKRRTKFRRNRTRSFEWLGPGAGIGTLIHQSELGEWDPATEFWSEEENLQRVEGRIVRIEAPQAGTIEIAGGLECFFVPARSEHVRGRSENQRVTLYLGFSFEGLRAWQVRNKKEGIL